MYDVICTKFLIRKFGERVVSCFCRWTHPNRPIARVFWEIHNDQSMDWFKEKNTGKPHDLNGKIYGFLNKNPLNQSNQSGVIVFVSPLETHSFASARAGFGSLTSVSAKASQRSRWTVCQPWVGLKATGKVIYIYMTRHAVCRSVLHNL